MKYPSLYMYVGSIPTPSSHQSSIYMSLPIDAFDRATYCNCQESIALYGCVYVVDISAAHIDHDLNNIYNIYICKCNHTCILCLHFTLNSLCSKFISLYNDEVIELSSDESLSGCKADPEEDLGLQSALCASLKEQRYILQSSAFKLQR